MSSRKLTLRKILPYLVAGLVGFATGAIAGFIVAWILCLKLLAILVLIPLGPFP